jgi:hypothetical protein
MTDTIFVLNGPNLNLLGTREPEIYGADTLDDIAGQLEDRGRELGLEIDMRQSNHEGHLVDWLHEAQARGAKAVILNAGASTTRSRGSKPPSSKSTFPTRTPAKTSATSASSDAPRRERSPVSVRSPTPLRLKPRRASDRRLPHDRPDKLRDPDPIDAG